METLPQTNQNTDPHMEEVLAQGNGLLPSFPSSHHVPRGLPAGRQWAVTLPWKDQRMRRRVAAERTESGASHGNPGHFLSPAGSAGAVCGWCG